MSTPTAAVRLLAAADGQPDPGTPGVQDRFMIDGADSEGRFALVQHLFAPRALAAPMHRHHDEDEYTYVLTGRIGAVLGASKKAGAPATCCPNRASWRRGGRLSSRPMLPSASAALLPSPAAASTTAGDCWSWS